MAERKRLPRLFSPIGEARFPHLIRPDTKFSNEGGDYKVDLRYTMDEVQELIQQLETIRDKFAEAQEPKVRKNYKIRPVYKMEQDDQGDETGKVLLTFKQKAIIKTPEGKTYDKRPRFFDSDNEQITGKALEEMRLYGGSKLAIYFEVLAYANAKDKEIGVSLRPKDIQIVELVSGGESPFSKRDGFKAQKPKAGDDADASSDDDDSPPADAGGEDEDF